uniref:Protein EXORDIUM-like 2 n=1 Tax=Araucaria cunninghamii TaxID=56994 RepID=A0A0D6QX74_ARACU
MGGGRSEMFFVKLFVVASLAGLCSSVLVKEEPLVLKYHNGPLLTASPRVDIHVIWYGKFSPVQRSVVGDFLQSLGGALREGAAQPSVSAWWNMTEGYKGAASNRGIVASKTRLGKQKLDEAYSLGKLLKRSDIATLVQGAVSSGALPVNPGAVYLVLTSSDVGVERFCMSSCGFHGKLSKGKRLLPYAWVGNSESQCPGQCAWPFHQPLYGPQTPPLIPPNGDVGVDGMVINIATVLAGTVTNPFNSGYFQGDAAAPLEAVSACPGIYGKGAYPGFPGSLLLDKTTGASYNGHGVNGRKFLVPAMWDPATRSCKTLV